MEYYIIGSIICIALYGTINYLINDKKIKTKSYKYKKRKNKNKKNKIQEKKYEFYFNNTLYTKKNKLITNNELKYYNILKNKFKKHIIIPQVNLAAIIEKKAKYRNELFRNIDFGIFNKNFELLLLIEINDETHIMPERIERDIKVNKILNGTNIKLLTLWTDSDKEKKVIIKKVKKELK